MQLITIEEEMVICGGGETSTILEAMTDIGETFQYTVLANSIQSTARS